jgi:hypothetical protein
VREEADEPTAAALKDEVEPDAFARELPVLVLLLLSCRVFEELDDEEMGFLEVESLSRLLSLELFDDFVIVDVVVVGTVLITFLLLLRLVPFANLLDSFPYTRKVRNRGEIVLEWWRYCHEDKRDHLFLRLA